MFILRKSLLFSFSSAPSTGVATGSSFVLNAAYPSATTLLPGTYTSVGAVAFNFPISLNCQNNNNTEFNFIVGGALAFNANVQRINGRCDVHWSVNGAAAIGIGNRTIAVTPCFGPELFFH